MRIVDLETKSYASSSRSPATPRRVESRIEELTTQLNQTNKDKSRSADKMARDAKFQAAESDRQRAKLEEERKVYEVQLQSLRQAMDGMVGNSETSTCIISWFHLPANRGKQFTSSQAARRA